MAAKHATTVAIFFYMIGGSVVNVTMSSRNARDHSLSVILEDWFIHISPKRSIGMKNITELFSDYIKFFFIE